MRPRFISLHKIVSKYRYLPSNCDYLLPTQFLSFTHVVLRRLQWNLPCEDCITGLGKLLLDLVILPCIGKRRHFLTSFVALAPPTASFAPNLRGQKCDRCVTKRDSQTRQECDCRPPCDRCVTKRDSQRANSPCDRSVTFCDCCVTFCDRCVTKRDSQRANWLCDCCVTFCDRCVT